MQIDLKNIEGIKNLVDEGGYDIEQILSVLNALNAIKKNDAKKAKDNTWEVFTHGGREPTQLNALEFAKLAQENGAGEILLTSMDRDGTKEGYDIELTKKISSSLNIPVIASGGVGNLEHLKDGIIKGGSSAVLAASIFHFGEYSIQEAKEYLKKENVPVRL